MKGILHVLVLLSGSIAGCHGLSPDRRPAPTPPVSYGAVANLYQGGRLAEMSERLARNTPWAEHEAPALLALLDAAQGRGEDAVSRIQQISTQHDLTRCLTLETALIQLYQLGDAQSALRSLGDEALRASGGACAASLPTRSALALRERLRPAATNPAFAVEGPDGEQLIYLDPVAASAGYLIVRIIFDTRFPRHSAQVLLVSGTPDIVVDRALAQELRLPVGADQQVLLPHFQLGLFTVRNAPALAADLSALSAQIHLRISRNVNLAGILPVQRVFGRGIVRLFHDGTELHAILDSKAAGPCRMNHAHATNLYQIDGALFADGNLAGSPPLLLRLELGQRRTRLRHSALNYTRQAAGLSIEQGESDVARPAITEAPVRERLRRVVLHLGEAQPQLDHVPLDASQAGSMGRPAEHGLIGTDLLAGFDMLVDFGGSHLYLAPPGHARCE